jgi:hypothetical protein
MKIICRERSGYLYDYRERPGEANVGWRGRRRQGQELELELEGEGERRRRL